MARKARNLEIRFEVARPGLSFSYICLKRSTLISVVEINYDMFQFKYHFQA